MEKKIIQKAGKFFTEEDKHQMIQEGSVQKSVYSQKTICLILLKEA